MKKFKSLKVYRFERHQEFVLRINVVTTTFKTGQPVYISLLTFLKRFHQGDLFTISSMEKFLSLSCASTTAIKAILTMLCTELPNCNTCTGFFKPSSMGPTASAPPSSLRRL